MNRWIFSSLILGIGLGLAACAAQAPLTDPVARGHRDFHTLHCARCHKLGDEGTDLGPGPNLTLVGFRKSPEWLDRWLANPHAWIPYTVMPNLHLTDEQRSDLVAFLSLQKGQAWKVKPWRTRSALEDTSVERGRIIFNKAGCVACHGPRGIGGKPDNNVAGGKIPALTYVSDGYSKDELMAKIAGGAVPIPVDASAPKPMIVMPRWKEVLEPDDISAVADYLLSLHPSTAKSADGF